MDIKTKVKQSLGLMALAVGIGLFAKYTGIDAALTPDKNNNKTQITQLYEEKTTYNNKNQDKETENNQENKTIKENNPTIETKIKEENKKIEIKEEKKRTTIETILEEEKIKNQSTNNRTYNSSDNSSDNNTQNNNNPNDNNKSTIKNNNKEDFSKYKSYENISNTEKKVFIYHQNLSSNEMMKEALEVTDYWMPHFYEIKQEKIGYDKKHKKNITHTIFDNRAPDNYLKKIIKNAKNKNVKNIMPMISAFDKKSVMSVLNNPDGYAKRIHKEIDKIGANGVSIDLESIDVGKEESGKLTYFMKTLRKEMPGYIITVAVSPRFAGSAEKGFDITDFMIIKDYQNMQIISI